MKAISTRGVPRIEQDVLNCLSRKASCSVWGRGSLIGCHFPDWSLQPAVFTGKKWKEHGVGDPLWTSNKVFHGCSKTTFVFPFLHNHFKRSSATSTSAFPTLQHTPAHPIHLRVLATAFKTGQCCQHTNCSDTPSNHEQVLGVLAIFGLKLGMTQTEQAHRTQIRPSTGNQRYKSSSPRRQKT